MKNFDLVPEPQFDTIAIQEQGYELSSSSNGEATVVLSLEPSEAFILDCVLASQSPFRGPEIYSDQGYTNLVGRGHEINRFKADFTNIRKLFAALETPLVDKEGARRGSRFNRSHDLRVVDERE